MVIDHHRTSRKEGKKSNCGCAEYRFPHPERSCRALKKRLYLESFQNVG